MKKQAADKKITNTTGLDDLIVESHGTKGSYNAYGFLAYDIKYDEKRELCSGDFGADTVISPKQNKKRDGGIIVIADGVETVDDCDNKEVSLIIEELKKAATKGLAGSWSIGRYLNRSYSFKEGESFSEKSTCVELTRVCKEDFLVVAKEICLMLGKDVLVKPYEDSEIIFIDDFDRLIHDIEPHQGF